MVSMSSLWNVRQDSVSHIPLNSYIASLQHPCFPTIEHKLNFSFQTDSKVQARGSVHYRQIPRSKVTDSTNASSWDGDFWRRGQIPLICRYILFAVHVCRKRLIGIHEGEGHVAICANLTDWSFIGYSIAENCFAVGIVRGDETLNCAVLVRWLRHPSGLRDYV